MRFNLFIFCALLSGCHKKAYDKYLLTGRSQGYKMSRKLKIPTGAEVSVVGTGNGRFERTPKEGAAGLAVV